MRWIRRQGLALIIAGAFAALGVSTPAAAQHEIYSFAGPVKNNANPHGAMIKGPNGSLIGATFGSPLVSIPCNCVGAGAVYRLSPPTHSGGAWTYEVLHAFNYPAGLYPGVVRDASGALYGVTYKGGPTDKGVVFRLEPPNWKLQIVHEFNGADGANPAGGLVFDQFGKLWGATVFGGASNQGVVFMITLTPGPQFHLVHSFTGGADGGNPRAGLTPGAPGALYGCTTKGGNSALAGTVFRTTDDSFATLFTFSGTDGTGCSDSLVLDAAGVLYGTTATGGPNGGGLGTVFKLAPSASGPWTHTILHAFSGVDGANPWGALVFAPSGNLYGVANGGPGPSPGGVIFKLTQPNWGFQVIPLTNPPFSSPQGGLTYYGNGTFAGTTNFGGADKYGDVFLFKGN